MIAIAAFYFEHNNSEEMQPGMTDLLVPFVFLLESVEIIQLTFKMPTSGENEQK